MSFTIVADDSREQVFEVEADVFGLSGAAAVTLDGGELQSFVVYQGVGRSNVSTRVMLGRLEPGAHEIDVVFPEPGTSYETVRLIARRVS